MTAVPAQAAEADVVVPNAATAVPGSYLVVFKQLPGISAVTDLASTLVGKHRGSLTHTYSALGGFAAKLSEREARRLAADPRVAYVEQDSVVTTQAVASYGLDRIDQRNLPLDNTYTPPNGGEGVTAYIVDTGVDMRHTDFGGRVTSGRDLVDNDNDASDCQGHGTHVAGTVGSATYGVAKRVSMVAVRVLNCSGSGTTAQVVGGIDWVTQNARKPAVINMSLGGGASSTIDAAVRRSVSAGITNAVASGNSNTNACNSSPARVAEAITVNATDRNDNRASFSNYGTCTDIFAPGVSIPSTRNGGGSHSLSGTSMATPHVAGAVALYLSANRSATPAQVQTALKNNATNNVVRNPGSGSTNKLLYVR
ncbi:S8 family peptidase [Amycolatopsis suaedae]|uniref:S8 family peptidase n=2 Tax=Amycolatopsis suaedae TaxID=2510978 RepID=A0A4Q7J5X5_9PSEU|nr:S8 family peptidase [Amycolatopsis suaedae]